MWLETYEINILIVALLNQAKKAECCIAKLSSCITGDNVLNKQYENPLPEASSLTNQML